MGGILETDLTFTINSLLSKKRFLELEICKMAGALASNKVVNRPEANCNTKLAE